jgi:5-methylcytosine-specific restriction endonuclease McrA
MAKKRDYKKEYKAFHGTPEQKKNRAKRNKNRRDAMAAGKVKPGGRKEIDHKRPLSKGGSNGPKNLRVISQKENRKKSNT